MLNSTALECVMRFALDCYFNQDFNFLQICYISLMLSSLIRYHSLLIIAKVI